jgi:hypothetical protein
MGKITPRSLYLIKMKKEKLVGGKGDKLTPKDIAKKFDVPVDKIKQQIKKGTDVEGEHTNNKEKAKEIATDHEAEIPNYYDELETMEKNIKENKILIKKLLREQMEESLASTIGSAAMSLATMSSPNVPTKSINNPIEVKSEVIKPITKNPDGSYNSIAKTDGPTKELAKNLAINKAKSQLLQKLNLGMEAINGVEVLNLDYQKHKNVIICTATVRININFDNKEIEESLEPTPQFRFNRRVYLTYVDQGDNFKNVKTKKEFYDKLYPLVDDVKVYEYDMNDIYRLADEKETWLSKRKEVLGQIWKDGDIESYWINKEFMG